MEDIEDTKYFDEYAIPAPPPPPETGKKVSDHKGNEYFAEEVDKSNNYLSHTMHVNIPEHQVQNMNINQLKYNPRKRKTSVCNKQIIDEIISTYLKEKAPLYVDGDGLTKKKKKDTSMKYLLKQNIVGL